MSNNDNNIEKRSFEAFVNAIGSEIEQAQVRLISTANAQMLFHYWKMGNYPIYDIKILIYIILLYTYMW